ncbi:hypothetical protein Hamer_G000366, partial [Homarus americanus]
LRACLHDQLPRMVVAHASDQWRSMGSEQGIGHCLVDSVFTRNCHTVCGRLLGKRFMAPKQTSRQRTAALLCVLAPGMILKKKQENGLCVGEKMREDTQDVQRYIRMTPEMYNTLLDKVRPHISRTDTNMRDSISGRDTQVATQLLGSQTKLPGKGWWFSVAVYTITARARLRYHVSKPATRLIV